MSGIVFTDISRHQGEIDWAAYAGAAGTRDEHGLIRAPVAICKATGGTEHSGGTTWVDPRLDRNRREMRARLTLRGYYHFLQFDAPPVPQARHFADTVGRLQPGEFAVLDVEGDANTAAHEAFCREVDARIGGTCWIYGGRQVRTTRPVWIARYFDETPNPRGEPDLDHVLWQFTSKGRFPGVDGNVDLNVHRGDVVSLARYAVPLTNVPDEEFTMDPEAKAAIADLKSDITSLRAAMDNYYHIIELGQAKGYAKDDGDPNHAGLVEIRRQINELSAKMAERGGIIDYEKLAQAVAPLLAADLAKRLGK